MKRILLITSLLFINFVFSQGGNGNNGSGNGGGSGGSGGGSGSGNGGNGNSGNGNITQQERYKRDEVIVKINPIFLDLEMINNKNIHQREVRDFVNPIGRENMNQMSHLPFDITKLLARKIFKDLSTCDLKSMSRQGTIVEMPSFWSTFVLKIPTNLPFQTVLDTLRSLYPFVIYAHPNYNTFETDANDNYYDIQSSLNSNNYPNAGINIDSAWQIETGKPHIKVGIFDSGIDSTHEDLDILTGFSYSLTSQDDNYITGTDLRGHGTAVAGVIGAKRNNNIGIAGIAGGNGSDSSGVSLIDFKVTANPMDVELVAVAVIDAARSVGTYEDWDLGYGFCTQPKSGYGIHLANHSYSLYMTRLLDVIDTTSHEPPPLFFDDCDLCKEAFLYSLKNGVVNVVSRGNFKQNGLPYNFYDTINKYPSGFDDSWVISVGASGVNGDLLDLRRNQELSVLESFSSMIGRDMDVIAPGTSHLIVTTKSNQVPIGDSAYMHFNGTSASAPHVTGVAALLLSKYNKDCYSNLNLDPADVEYLIQKSATDLKEVGYDDSAGWGRLDAHKALKMIDFPRLQIVHPQTLPINSQLIEQDTLIMFLNRPLSERGEGPYGTEFYSDDIRPTQHYKLVKYKYKNTYSFSNYFLQSTELLDTWVRHSQTNTLGNMQDTSGYSYGAPPFGDPAWRTLSDTFMIEPKAEIVFVDTLNQTIDLTGYVYHFIKIYLTNDVEEINNVPQFDIDFWYPFDPNESDPKMAYSVYMEDVNFTQRYDFPCDSLNILVDPTAQVYKLETEHAFEVFPNPSYDGIQVFVKHGKNSEKIRLVDLNGTIIFEKNIKEGNKIVSFDTENLNAGIYLVQWITDEQVKEIKKWVKL